MAVSDGDVDITSSWKVMYLSSSDVHFGTNLRKLLEAVSDFWCSYDIGKSKHIWSIHITLVCRKDV